MESAWTHVAKFFNLKDMIMLTATCRRLHAYDELWHWFYHAFEKTLNSQDKYHIAKLKHVFFSKPKQTCIAFGIWSTWLPLSIPDQLESFASRSSIIFFLIASMVKNGRNTVHEYNTYIDSMITNGNKIAWLCSSWEVLNGTTPRFRRQAVY